MLTGVTHLLKDNPVIFKYDASQAKNTGHRFTIVKKGAVFPVLGDKMDSVVHFEIPFDDLERAKKFYSELFSWEMQDMPEMNYTIVRTAETDKNRMITQPGKINGGMYKRQKPGESPVLVVDVKNIDQSIKRAAAKGSKIISGKKPVGDMGFYAQITDSEGNTIGLWQTVKKE